VQLSPDGSQLSHWSANVIGVVPLQLPLVAMSVWPSWGVPDTVGGEVSAGGVGWTTGVGDDVAGALPALFDAVTTTSSVPATSALATVYVGAVATAMSAQLAPFESQRCHW
jgi:hypothetical protein